MGIFAKGLKAGIGWPNPGWAPPNGITVDTISGAAITYDSAMAVGTFAAGIRLIAEDIASLPLIVYRRLDRGKQRAPEHRMYGLLHDAPNPEMTSMIWRETGIGHLYSWGNWYAERELNALGQTVQLWPLRPDRMTVDLDASGERIYKYRLGNGQGVVLRSRNVFHVPGFGFDGLVGYSRIALMRRAIENAQAVEEYGLRTFANGAQPGVLIRHKEQLSRLAKANIVESWDEQHAGLSNAQRTAVLDEGMEIEQIGFPPEDAQFLESRRFSVEEIARGLRLSPHKLSDHSRSTFNNIEENNIDHVTGTLAPTCTRIEQQINKDLLGDREYFVEHLLDARLRGKTLERAQAQQVRILSGTLSPDEARAQENQNPLPDGQGDVYLAPLNMSPLDQLADAVAARASAPAPASAKAGETVIHNHMSPVTVQPAEVKVSHVQLPEDLVETAVERATERGLAVVTGGMGDLRTRETERMAAFLAQSDAIIGAVADLRAELRAPRVKTVVRGKDGRIIEVREESA